MTSADRDRDDAIAAARGAASHAHMIIDRVFGIDGGFVGRVESDDFAGTDVTAQGARDLADLLPAVAEHARYFREVFGSLTSGSQPTIWSGTASSTGLPLNRKEQYYTATVLPMIVASDGFAYLHRFLASETLLRPQLGHEIRENSSSERRSAAYPRSGTGSPLQL